MARCLLTLSMALGSMTVREEERKKMDKKSWTFKFEEPTPKQLALTVVGVFLAYKFLTLPKKTDRTVLIVPRL